MKRNQNKNLAKLLRKSLPGNIFNIIRRIGVLAEDNGFAAYIVGGCVRDILMKRANLDLDVVVETDAIAFARILQKRINLEVLRHKRFGTARLTLANGFKIDIASARRECYADIACLPTVSLSSIKNDLQRRDFTINTLAVKINSSDFGQLLDLFDGRRDIIEGKIRLLHDKSLLDDPTRILRAVRFAQRLGFSLERHTQQLIKRAIKDRLLNRLTKSRIGNEIILILKEEEPLRALWRLQKLCGLRFIHPTIRLDKTAHRQFKLAQGYISSFRKNFPGVEIEDWLVYFMILTSRLKTNQLDELARAFSFTKKDLGKLRSLKHSAGNALQALGGKRSLLPHQIYQILAPFSLEELLVLLGTASKKIVRTRIGLFLNKLRLIETKLSGTDLKRIKVSPGPQFRAILQQVLYAKVNGKLKSKTDELNYAKRILRG